MAQGAERGGGRGGDRALLEDAVAARSDSGDAGSAPSAAGVRVARLVSVDTLGRAQVCFGDEARARAARSTLRLGPAHSGADVLVVCEQEDPARPIVIGVLHDPLAGLDAEGREDEEVEARVDGQRVVLEGSREVLLRCGQASILLTPDGRIRIRGTDLVSRSSGGNRIKGASVQIN